MRARTEGFGFQIIPLQLFTCRYHLLNIQHIYKDESGGVGQHRWTSIFKLDVNLIPSWQEQLMRAGSPDEQRTPIIAVMLESV
jgi:hypothetical protein